MVPHRRHVREHDQRAPQDNEVLPAIPTVPDGDKMAKKVKRGMDDCLPDSANFRGVVPMCTAH